MNAMAAMLAGACAGKQRVHTVVSLKSQHLLDGWLLVNVSILCQSYLEGNVRPH